AAALPFRGDGGERVQHGGGQRLRCAVERVVGGAGVGEHVRAEHGAQLTALGRVGEQRGEDLVGGDGGGDGSHTHILGTTKARPAGGEVCLRSRRPLSTPSAGATGGAGTSSSGRCTVPRRGAADCVTTREGCSALEAAGLDEGDAGGRVLG